MLKYAIVLMLYSQATDNTIELDMQLFANPKLCREQGLENVDRKLAARSRTGKPVRSAWFTCQPVYGKAARVRSSQR